MGNSQTLGGVILGVPNRLRTARAFLFMTTEPIESVSGFTDLGLSRVILHTLSDLGFVEPTPIQRQAIPIVGQGHDLIGIAQTGTGKTFAFGLPLMERLKESEGTALILVPSRELALQVEESLLKLARPLRLRTAVIIGGASMGRQVAQLRTQPRIIVATPGRLTDHLQQGTLSLKTVQVVVLDEADRMLDMGFEPAIRRILMQTPATRQTLLFSATMPNSVARLAEGYLRDPKRVEIKPAGTRADSISQELIVSTLDNKLEVLTNLLYDEKGTVLVFARTRHGARKLAKYVKTLGHTVAELHADRTQSQRKEALDGFRSGRYRILVATDVAARGIDVPCIGLVVNFDLPDQAEDYVHRIGRTGRAGETGKAITMATPEQTQAVMAIERILRAEIPLSTQSLLTLERRRPMGQGRPHTPGKGRPFQGGNRSFGGGGHSGGGDRRGPSTNGRAFAR